MLIHIQVERLMSHSSLYLETLQCIPSYMLGRPYSLNTETEE